MDQHALVAVGPSYRNGGRAAIISGAIGIAAFGLLMDAVLTRVSWIPPARIYILFGAHDIGVALQFLLLIPVAFGLRTLSRQSAPGLSKATFATGVGAAIFVVLLVLLGVGNKIVSNGLYMFPQGIFGIWLMVVNWRLSGSLPGQLRWLGIIVGLGLALVGTSFVGLCFVYPSGLAIPAVPQESIKEVDSVANTFFHQLLFFASFVGVAPLPIWTILTGSQLLKKSRLAAIAQIAFHMALALFAFHFSLGGILLNQNGISSVGSRGVGSASKLQDGRPGRPRLSGHMRRLRGFAAGFYTA